VNGGFISELGPQIAAHIEAKRALGKQFEGGEYYLRRFDRYCADHGHTSMTRQAVEGMARELDAGPGKARRGWVCYLRGLALHMRVNGSEEAYALPDFATSREPAPRPYLFSCDELDAFFLAAAAFDYPPPWKWQAAAFFGLMLACGLRTCEARRLARADVDSDARSITINNSKGPNTRVLPISDGVAAALAACDTANHEFWRSRESFFTTRRGTLIGTTAPPVVFNRVWDQAELPRPPQGQRQPRPYDLRHHFAYANIERWSAQGEDPLAMLPYLSRYMGHASAESTLYYVHVSPDYLSDYGAGLHASAALLPEAGFR
jgi:integrase